MSGKRALNPIPDSLHPGHLDYLLAKSEAYGGDTLTQHTWDVICRLSDQYRLRSTLADQMGNERLWHRMYWASFFHDFGKAAQGFQERLQNPKVDNQWALEKHRHEVLSLAFVEWLFPPGHVDRLPILCAVVCHHKDAYDIFDKYGGNGREPDQHRRIEFIVSQVLPAVADDLWIWLEQYGMEWQQAAGIPAAERVVPMRRESFGVEAVCGALDEFNNCLIGYEDGLFDAARILVDMHYRGLILTADHAASAGAAPFPQLRLTQTIASRPLPVDKHRWRSHQHDALTAGEGSALMIAPTGSGKTEAALLWAARQIEHRPASRLFYTLPYQASMNAMEKRLKERFFQGDTPVTIQHSRATLKFYQDMMEADSGLNPKQAVRNAKALKNLAELNYYPVQVFSPYQMLKAAYSLKGYEALLVDYTNGLFIFDEIHAYEASRLALIITMMGWLAENYGARFLVMTATMPPMVEEALKAALSLSNQDIIVASKTVFKESQRHEVHLLDGDLLDDLKRIAAEGRQKKVLVCCNQVDRAQKVYQRLKEDYGFTRDNILLLHGRFNGKDRTDKERMLGDVVGVRKSPRAYVIVATQVVEVSLDIDLDTIYTDPAPLEALLQRFGRVNRGRGEKAPLCPVHVYRVPVGEKESKPYDFPLVQASLEVLEGYCGRGRPIDEALVTTMLHDIYGREAIERDWWEKYTRSERAFREVLDRMKPYQSADLGTFQEFYRLFDGTQVLPADCENDYYDAMDKGGYLAASQYLVNISWRQYNQLMQTQIRTGKKIIVKREDEEFADHVNIDYSEEWGLDIAGALAAKDEDE